jgi:hypothetical protein
MSNEFVQVQQSTRNQQQLLETWRLHLYFNVGLKSVYLFPRVSIYSISPWKWRER